MTIIRFVNIVLTILLTLVFAWVLGVYAPSLDAQTYDRDSDLGDAQRAAKKAMRRDLAAAKICREEFGAGTTFLWTERGDLVCTPKNGGRQ